MKKIVILASTLTVLFASEAANSTTTSQLNVGSVPYFPKSWSQDQIHQYNLTYREKLQNWLNLTATPLSPRDDFARRMSEWRGQPNVVNASPVQGPLIPVSAAAYPPTYLQAVQSAAAAVPVPSLRINLTSLQSLPGMAAVAASAQQSSTPVVASLVNKGESEGLKKKQKSRRRYHGKK